MSHGGNDYEKDLQHLTSTIGGKISEGVQKTESFSSACIYRVPEELRKLKENAYTPRLIAIGPLHQQKDKHLQTHMQHVKMSYVDNLLRRQLNGGMEGLALAEKKNAVLRECVVEMKKLIDNAKKCYVEEVTLDEEMLLVDGCFILEFLYRSRSLYLKNRAEKRRKPIDEGDNGNSKGQETDPIFGNSSTIHTVENDLVLLENQIPFFVLEELFQLMVVRILNRPDENWSLTDYVWWCYEERMRPVGNSTNTKTWCSPGDCWVWIFGNNPQNSSTSKNEVLSAHEYYHILHNLHDRYLPRGQTKQKEPSQPILMPSASELYFAGVKFVPDAGDSLFKFKFKKPKAGLWLWRRARFNIPPLAIYDDTELFLRNLIAFEQSCTSVSQNVTSYACVMDMLVNTDKDVQVLEKGGVMRNYLGAGEDATRLFNNLCKEIIEGEYYFADVCIEATEYSKSFWPKHVIHLRRTYFASPWTFIAFIVGFIVFVISLVQFVGSFLKKENGGCSCEGTKRWGT